MTVTSALPDLRLSAELTPDQIRQALQLRHEVFILEAKRARGEETDQYDQDAWHMAALRGDTVVAALRVYRWRPQDTALRIGRVAVRRELRGQGIGRELMRFACRRCFEAGVPAVYLHAEISVAGFYEKLGFVREGEPFEESGTTHVRMTLAAKTPAAADTP